MRITLVSDLHFEINDYPNLKAKDFGGDVLIISGDLTCARFFNPRRNDSEARSHRKFIKKFNKEIASKYDKCFYVVGNHEHYRYIFDQTIPSLREGLKDTNITLLDNESVEYQDVLFYGTTLWTSYDNGNAVEMNVIQQMMNDYAVIFQKDPTELSYVERRSGNTATIDPQFIFDVHRDQLAKLETFLADNRRRRVVVITHHAPTLLAQNVGRYGTNLTHAYCSDLHYLMAKYANIELWTYGHTHDSMDMKIENTRVVSNQLGYVGYDRSSDRFNALHIEI